MTTTWTEFGGGLYNAKEGLAASQCVGRQRRRLLMFVIFGTSTRAKKVATGFFYCPSCRARLRCTARSVESCFTLFFIPMGSLKTLGSVYECEHCHTQFDIDCGIPFDFGSHEQPKVWRCEHCGQDTPNHSFTCVHCGE